MTVEVLPEAEDERAALPLRGRKALQSALAKLEAIGEALAFPHTSAVRIASEGLRELRPRGGHSRWRALYRRIKDVLVVGAIGPEAESDPRGFERAVARAEERLATRQAEEDDE